MIDPRYGKIFFTAYSFGLNEEGNYEVFSAKELQSHQCSLEELGLAGTDHKFFPISQKQRRSLQAMAGAFVCVDQSELEVAGSTSSFEKAKNISIELTQCMGKDYCETDEKIKEYFSKS